MMKHVLNISNAFMGTKVHRNLAIALDKIGARQSIFTVVRKYKQQGKDNLVDFSNKHSKIAFSRTLKIYHRVFFTLKISQLYKDLKQQIDIGSVDIVHATTLYSDGALAYRIFKEFGIPYVITVRSADLDYFMKYRPDLLSFGMDILTNAKNVMFVSPSLKKRFLAHRYIVNKKDVLVDKIVVTNNGIDDFWIDNRFIHTERKKTDSLKLLYVGRLIKRKNLLLLIDAIKILRKEFFGLTLHIVGSGGGYEKEVLAKAKSNSDFVTIQSEIKDRKELMQVYRKHDAFVMPSFYETFGLVYLEALSQGLPVLMAKDDGIDGVFPDHSVGESADPKSLDSVVASLRMLIENTDDYNIGGIDFEKYRWKSVADRLMAVYTS